VGSTNRAGTVSGALELARDLVEATGRRLQEYVAPLLERLHSLMHGRAAAIRPEDLARDRAARDTEVARRGQLDVDEQTPFGHGAPPAAVEGELPLAYGQSRAVLVARDPWWLFAHWEVPPVRRVEVLRALGELQPRGCLVAGEDEGAEPEGERREDPRGEDVRSADRASPQRDRRAYAAPGEPAALSAGGSGTLPAGHGRII